MNKIWCIALTLLPLFFVINQAVCLERPQQPIEYKHPKIALTHATLIDGSGEPAKYDQTVLISGGRFIKVGSSKKLKVPAGFDVINAHNKTVIPGIIGVHNHLHLPGHPYNGSVIARLYLAAGVTTIQTAGSAFPEEELNLAKEVISGGIVGPTVVASGPYFDGAAGNPNMVNFLSEEKLRETVQEWIERGVFWFKVYRHIMPEQLMVIIDEAHKHGGYVTGHLCSMTFQQAVSMGIDGIHHGFNSLSDFREGKKYGECGGSRSYIDDLELEGEKINALLELLVKNNVFMVSTLSIYESSISHRAIADKKSLALMSDGMRGRYELMRENAKDKDLVRERRLKRIMKFEYLFHKKGGLLGSGVDAGRFVLPGFGDQRNYELLIEAGFSSEEAVQVMTKNGAKILGVDDIGLIKEGMQADFVILNGNLLRKSIVIRAVDKVFKKGSNIAQVRFLKSCEE